jgi:hypothetical protein
VDNRQGALDARDCVLGSRYLLLGSITLLVLAEFAGEEDETGAVLL